MNYLTDIVKRLEESKIYIYGAGLMGRALLKCIRETGIKCEVLGFLVGERGNNPYEIEGVSVKTVNESQEAKACTVLIALHEKHMNSAKETLLIEGYEDIYPISFDCDEWSDIRLCWLKQHREVLPFDIDFANTAERLSNKMSLAEYTSVYVARSIYDKSTHDSVQEIQSYEKYIQVGKALTDERLCEITDDKGENISSKNKRYCELTALYWAWKNDDYSEYKGLSHYRRRFSHADDIEYMDNGYDFALTVPIINFDTVREQFGKDHSEMIWNTLQDVIGEICPDYLPDLKAIGDGIVYFGYNMFIARKDAFDEYSDWLFPILFEVERHIGGIDDKYQNRYAGFVAERLLSVYLRHNRDKYKVTLASKHFSI